MNDKLRELNIYLKSDEEMDNIDFAKSSIENAINDEMRDIIIRRKTKVGEKKRTRDEVNIAIETITRPELD